MYSLDKGTWRNVGPLDLVGMEWVSTSEGEISFQPPNSDKAAKTWYTVFGDLNTASPVLIVLHGGPGAGHEYMLPLTDLNKQHGMTVLLYEQVGCGRSTHFRDRLGDDMFWTFDLFIQELDNLIDTLGIRKSGFHLLGHSWGGMLAAVYASKQPEGLGKLVLASAPASVPAYIEGAEQLRAALPPEMRDALEHADPKSPEYEAALKEFYARHLCRLDPFPAEIQKSFEHLEDDPTAYLTLQGPSEVEITGSLKNWEGWKLARDITADTLILNGRYDEMTDHCVAPWFTSLRRVKWATLEQSSHMGHWEDRVRFGAICERFLTAPKQTR
ncbi:proline-specific peptidase [Nemania sp. NC0429]|nr:proline-specific peptidase [Nemania sp. NC0429]